MLARMDVRVVVQVGGSSGYGCGQNGCDGEDGGDGCSNSNGDGDRDGCFEGGGKVE